ncbi:hypothetical protein IACHDJAJ_00058 [Aeromonas phage vB_AdhS_TS3]|nr:hypothetical protein IACHDJAJ_00058 [Aeromonas phage vB_AdhS_TS3]
MRSFRVVITFSSGEVIERVTTNPSRLIKSFSKEWPQRPEYEMLQILGLTGLVKGYIMAYKVEPFVKS